ncbi:hypothetical protein KC345_g3611 [Hortaea werneckii]|nr:hypothetical protein KC345_g3611 [Hortaea werneckii]
MTFPGSKVFITGATGYTGLVLAEYAVKAGHQVRGLSRSSTGDQKLQAVGAFPVRGDLSSLDTMRRESSNADVVMHLAWIHDFQMDYDEVLRIDKAAVAALAEPLKVTQKPLLYTSVTSLVRPDPSGGETMEDAPEVENPLLRRMTAERAALEWVDLGVRLVVIRLPPYVYGRGGSVFLPLLMQQAVKHRRSIYPEAGNIHTTDVHVDDAARLYLLAAEKAAAGEVFNGTAGTTVTVRQMAEAISRTIDCPAVSVSRDEAVELWGEFLVNFVSIENRASSRKAREQLGWRPREAGMLTDLVEGSYVETAKRLKEEGGGF